MTGITAILHTQNDELRIARAIESLRPCDEVLVIDHTSSDETRKVARRFGARVITAHADSFETQPFLSEALHDWIFCMLPTEFLSEGLEAALLEWKLSAPAYTSFEVLIIEESSRKQETRLVKHTHTAWNSWMPRKESGAVVLDGYLLRMSLP